MIWNERTIPQPPLHPLAAWSAPDEVYVSEALKLDAYVGNTHIPSPRLRVFHDHLENWLQLLVLTTFNLHFLFFFFDCELTNCWWNVKIDFWAGLFVSSVSSSLINIRWKYTVHRLAMFASIIMWSVFTKSPTSTVNTLGLRTINGDLWFTKITPGLLDAESCPFAAYFSLRALKKGFLCCLSPAINFKANKHFETHSLSVVLNAQTSLCCLSTCLIQLTYFQFLDLFHMPLSTTFSAGHLQPERSDRKVTTLVLLKKSIM